MEKGDSNFLKVLALIVVGSLFLSYGLTFAIDLFLPFHTAIWVLLTYGVMFILTAFALHNQAYFSSKIYWYIATGYVAIITSSFPFMEETKDVFSVNLTLIGIYSIPLIIFLGAWFNGKRHHLY